MRNKLKLIKPFKPTFLTLFLMLGFGVLSCNNPETQEQQNEVVHDQYETIHDEHIIEEDTVQEGMMQEDTAMYNGM